MAYMWSHRGDVLTRLIQHNLAAQGLGGDLSVEEFSGKKLTLNYITIRSGDEAIFTSKSLIAKYQWRAMIKGEVEAIIIQNASIDIEVDKDGKIISDWFPKPNNTSANSLPFPSKGISIQSSQINVKSPYGDVKARGDINAANLETLTARLDLSDSDLNLGEMSLRGGGKLSIDMKPGRNDVSAQLQVSHITHPKARLEDVKLEGKLTFDLVDGLSHIDGPIKIQFTDIQSDVLSANGGVATWDGAVLFSPKKASISPVKGDWDITLSQAAYADNTKRLALANKLTSYDAISRAPIVQPFSAPLRDSILELFSNIDIDASGKLSRNNERLELHLKRPMTIKNSGANVSIAPVASKPFYSFSLQEQIFKVNANAAIENEFSFELQKLKLSSQSKNGIQINRIKSIEAQFKMPAPWQTYTKNMAATLLPVSAPISYINSGDERIIKTHGNVNYTGPVPSGTIDALRAQGRLSLNLKGDKTTTVFTQASNQPIRFEHYTPDTSDWRLGPTSLSQPTQSFKFTKHGNTSRMIAGFQAASTSFSNPETLQHIPAAFSNIDISGLLKGGTQNWLIKSEIVQGEINAPEQDALTFKAGTFNVSASSQGGQIESLALSTPNGQVVSNAFTAKNIAFNAAGNMDDLTINYGAADQLAALNLTTTSSIDFPFYGQTHYKTGAFNGTVTLRIPKTDESVANIDYFYQDGKGEADISIEGVEFKRGKLQPQSYLPSLRGKIADVNGFASADINVKFEGGAISHSSGLLTLSDMAFGTLPGPFSGVNTQIKLKSIFPLATEGKQILTADKFDPGIPLVSGEVEYELLPEGVKIYAAQWPIGGGTISLTPTLWNYTAEKNTLGVNVNDVSIGAFLDTESLSATGTAQGSFPVVIEGLDVFVRDGKIAVKNGGTIRYNSGVTQPITPNEFSQDPSQLAFQALQNFQYESLEAKLDGPLDGEIGVSMEFKGKNPDVLGGTPFDFNVNIAGELFNLARNIKMGNDLQAVQQLLINQNTALEMSK
ncbi:MAG: intermembrane phospholipid transport protein YdbH family protein [Maricaulaceae bacterium]